MRSKWSPTVKGRSLHIAQQPQSLCQEALALINHSCRHASVLKCLFGIVFYFECKPFVPLEEVAVAFERAKRFLGNGRQVFAIACPELPSPTSVCSSQYHAMDSGRPSVPAGLKLHVCHITAWGGRLVRSHAVGRCHENLRLHGQTRRRLTFKRLFELYLALEHKRKGVCYKYNAKLTKILNCLKYSQLNEKCNKHMPFNHV